jgi:hypothetical protein
MHDNHRYQASPPCRAANYSTSGVLHCPTRFLTPEAAFTPAEIAVLVAVFEDALRGMQMIDRTDAAAEIIARRIIELASQGERDPIKLRDGALQSLSP